MPFCSKSGFSVLAENHGQKRENGVERTSAIVPTFCACSIATKRSAGLLEWPML